MLLYEIPFFLWNPFFLITFLFSYEILPYLFPSPHSNCILSNHVTMMLSYQISYECVSVFCQFPLNFLNSSLEKHMYILLDMNLFILRKAHTKPSCNWWFHAHKSMNGYHFFNCFTGKETGEGPVWRSERWHQSHRSPWSTGPRKNCKYSLPFQLIAMNWM